MNKLINTFNKGFSLYNDDVRFLQEALTEAIKALASPFENGEIIILSGCEKTVSLGIASFTEGYVLKDSEIFKVPATSFSTLVPGSVEKFFLSETYNSSGLKISDDGLDSNDSWLIREYNIAMGEFALPNQSFSSTKRLFEVIKEKLPQKPWETFKTFTDTEFLTGDYESDISLGIDGITVLRGKMMFNDVSPGDVVATIPVGFRPTQAIERSVSYYAESAVQTLIVRISTSGQVTFTNTPTYSIVFDFGQVLGWSTN
jgi:hypothetical protein